MGCNRTSLQHGLQKSPQPLGEGGQFDKGNRGPPANPADTALYRHHYLLRPGFPLLQSRVSWEIHLLVSGLSNFYNANS